ncbi:hypothetical protein HanIR_Chr01g0045661 [Helianthus annuus]|nr:hypothetical protein HanIR_Chr01g0045661 [Helianthus annuus]
MALEFIDGGWFYWDSRFVVGLLNQTKSKCKNVESRMHVEAC